MAGRMLGPLENGMVQSAIRYSDRLIPWRVGAPMYWLRNSYSLAPVAAGMRPYYLGGWSITACQGGRGRRLLSRDVDHLRQPQEQGDGLASAGGAA
jgi:hypothetical protein